MAKSSQPIIFADRVNYGLLETDKQRKKLGFFWIFRAGFASLSTFAIPTVTTSSPFAQMNRSRSKPKSSQS